MATVYAVLDPRVTVLEAGVAVRAKSGGASTERLIIVECARLPLLPVTITT
jgi:hypothetical protein